MKEDEDDAIVGDDGLESTTITLEDASGSLIASQHSHG